MRKFLAALREVAFWFLCYVVMVTFAFAFVIAQARCFEAMIRASVHGAP